MDEIEVGKESVEEPKVKFSWVALYEIARPEGYRVVIEVPSKALIKIQPEDEDHNPIGKHVTVRLRNNSCFVLTGGSVTEELEEGQLMATSRPIRPKTRDQIIATGQADPLPTIGELLASDIPEGDCCKTPQKPEYGPCNRSIGFHRCNLPQGHNGACEYLHCCLNCGCRPCICNGS
jgi:hypothetical protein